MTDRNINDNGFARAPRDGSTPDAMGQAALLLVESLVHGLIARKVISVADAVEIVEVATEVKGDSAGELGDTQETMERSLALLGAMHASLSNDLPTG